MHLVWCVQGCVHVCALLEKQDSMRLHPIVNTIESQLTHHRPAAGLSDSHCLLTAGNARPGLQSTPIPNPPRTALCTAHAAVCHVLRRGRLDAASAPGDAWQQQQGGRREWPAARGAAQQGCCGGGGCCAQYESSDAALVTTCHPSTGAVLQAGALYDVHRHEVNRECLIGRACCYK